MVDISIVDGGYNLTYNWGASHYRLQSGIIYPLVNVYITMENHHAINGKTHYFNGHFQ